MDYLDVIRKMQLDAVQETKPECRDWLAGWREAVILVRGIREDDRRFPCIRAALSRLDDAFHLDDWLLFQRMLGALRHIVTQEPPA